MKNYETRVESIVRNAPSAHGMHYPISQGLLILNLKLCPCCKLPSHIPLPPSSILLLLISAMELWQVFLFFLFLHIFVLLLHVHDYALIQTHCTSITSGRGCQLTFCTTLAVTLHYLLLH